MSDPPIDYDSLAARLADTLQSIDVSSLQQWGDTDSTTEDTDPATDYAIHKTLGEIGTHLEDGRGFEVWSSTTEEHDIFARRYGADVDGSDREEESVGEESVEEEPVNEDAVDEGPDGDGLLWEDQDQVNDASAYDWRSDPFAKCCSCFEEHQPVEDVWQAQCEHIYCNACLEVLVNEWYKSTRAPACCGIPMPWEDFKTHINSDLAAALDAKREELESHDRIYCWDQT
jgi:hypothetical protein